MSMMENHPPGLGTKVSNRWIAFTDHNDQSPKVEEAQERKRDLQEMESYKKEFPKIALGNYSKNQVKKKMQSDESWIKVEEAVPVAGKERFGEKQLNLFYPTAARTELHPCITAETRSGGWKYIKGVMDSGATDSVIHPSECAEYEIEESEGSRAGQNWTSASGGVIPNLGQKILEVVTDDGVESKVKYQAADVSRTLNSITEICDAGGDEGQYVIFSKWGGTVYNPAQQRQTPFEREGGIYTMGMWVKPKAPFQRQAE